MTMATVAERPAGVDPRIEQRRRQVVADRRRRRARRVLVVPVALTLAAAAWGVARSPALDVDDVLVEGAIQTSPDDVRAQAGIRTGDALLDVDGSNVADAVGTLPWVGSVEVERRFRDGVVVVRVAERAPAAVVAGGDAYLVVDAGGRVLVSVPTAPDEAGAEPAAAMGVAVAGLPVLDGVEHRPPGELIDAPGIEALQVAMALSPGLATRVASVHPGDRGIELDLTSEGRALVGSPTDLDEKVRTLQTVFADVQLTCLATVDVRVPDTAVLTREAGCL